MHLQADTLCSLLNSIYSPGPAKLEEQILLNLFQEFATQSGNEDCSFVTSVLVGTHAQLSLKWFEECGCALVKCRTPRRSPLIMLHLVCLDNWSAHALKPSPKVCLGFTSISDPFECSMRCVGEVAESALPRVERVTASDSSGIYERLKHELRLSYTSDQGSAVVSSPSLKVCHSSYALLAAVIHMLLEEFKVSLYVSARVASHC
jgi:hypothetical protein